MVCFFRFDDAIVKRCPVNLFGVLILINQKLPWGDIEAIFCLCDMKLSGTPGESISREYKLSCFA